MHGYPPRGPLTAATGWPAWSPARRRRLDLAVLPPDESIALLRSAEACWFGAD